MSPSSQDRTGSPKYSWNFGQTVVERFTEKYPRGSHLLARLVGITYVRLCEILIDAVRSSKQLRWESLKIMIKQLEWEDWEDYKRLNPGARAKYLTIMKYQAEGDALDEQIAQNLT